jgi:hypothetical protein
LFLFVAATLERKPEFLGLGSTSELVNLTILAKKKKKKKKNLEEFKKEEKKI